MNRTGKNEIGIYLESIRAIPRITPAEADRIGAIVRDGERPDAERLAARNRLVAANLGLVVDIAKRRPHSPLSFADRIGHGNRGLVVAAEKFDPSRGRRFSTMATHWIRQAIRRAEFREGHPIRVPDYLVDGSNRHSLNPACIAAAEAIVAAEFVGGDLPALTETEGRRRTPLDEVIAREDRDRLIASLGRLEERDRAMVVARYGDGEDAATIAGRAGLTVQAVYSRLDLARRKLRAAMGAA